jgi:hypothetical protein
MLQRKKKNKKNFFFLGQIAFTQEEYAGRAKIVDNLHQYAPN